MCSQATGLDKLHCAHHHRQHQDSDQHEAGDDDNQADTQSDHVNKNWFDCLSFGQQPDNYVRDYATSSQGYFLATVEWTTIFQFWDDILWPGLLTGEPPDVVRM